MHSEDPPYTNEELKNIARRLKDDYEHRQTLVHTEDLTTDSGDYSFVANKAGLLLLAAEFIDKAADSDARPVQQETLASRIDRAPVHVTISDGEPPEFTTQNLTLKNRIGQWLLIGGFLFLILSLFVGIVEMIKLVYHFTRALFYH